MSENKLNKLISQLSPQRKSVTQDLLTRKWFQNTDFKVQEQLLTLPEDFDGFLKDLGSRPEEIGNIKVLKLQKLQHGNYILIPIFKVRSLLTNEEFTYELASFKYGQNPGSRGVILVESDGEIKFIIVRYSHKFQIADSFYEAIGSFHTNIDYTAQKAHNFSNKIKNRLKDLLEVPQLNFKEFIDLGQMYTDTGMTNNHSNLFAAIIDSKQAQKLEQKAGENLTSWSPGSELAIFPIEKLPELISQIDDSFFLSCIARLTNLGLINPASKN